MFNMTDNDTNLIPLEEFNNEKLRQQLPAIIYTAGLMVIGTPGNAIVLYVYFFKWRRSTSRMFILYLALLDFINCITTLPMEIFIMRYSVMLDLPFICKLSRFSTYTMNSSSALILVGIAVDRFKRICRPYQRTFSENVSKCICIGAIVFSLSLTWPSIILYGTRRFQFGHILAKSCLIENKFDTTPYPIAFFGIMALMTLLIFTTLSVLYYFVGMQIYKHRMFKLRNCSHVEKIVEEKSTEKSQTIKSKDPTSKASNEHESNDIIGNGIVITHEKPSDSEQFYTAESQNEDTKRETRSSYGLLRVPVNLAKELSTDRSVEEFSTVNIELDSHSNVENQVKLTEVPNGKETDHANVSERNSPPVKGAKKRRKRVRYLLVRGSSTLNSSGRAKCASCLTVRVGKSTFMLFLITIAYIISFLPFYIIALIRQSNSLFVQQLSPAGSMAYYFFLRSYLLSSAINPIIYSFCNVQFRGYCIDLFKKIFTRKSAFNEFKMKAMRR